MIHLSRWLLVGALLPLLGQPMTSCAWTAASVDRAAQDRMLLVRDSPPSLGYRRLLAIAQTFPDLATFLRLEGQPDFLAETAIGARRYLVFYYLERRQAHVCRAWSDESQAIEFAGPYAITEKEARLLVAMRDESAGPQPPR